MQRRGRKKTPHARGSSLPGGELLHTLDVGSLLAFRALRDFEGNLLTFFQGLKALHLNCGEVGEQIFAAVVRSDESKAFGIVEPLDGTCCHKSVFQIITNHTSRKSKKPRDTLPPLITCSLHIDNTTMLCLSTDTIVPAKNIKVKAVPLDFLSFCKRNAE